MSQGRAQLRVGAAIRVAAESLWLHRRTLLGWSLGPIVASGAITLLMQPFLHGLELIQLGQQEAVWLPGAVVAGYVLNILITAVWTLLELRCYRLFLLGAGADLTAPALRAIYVSLFAFNLIVLMVNVLPATLLDYVRIVGETMVLESLAWVIIPLYLYLTVRLAFVYPAISLGWSWDVRQRWIETRGNFWRLLLALVLAQLPYLALMIVLSSFGLDVWGPEINSGGFGVLDALLRSALSLTYLLPATAVIAAAVAQVTGYRAAGMTGQGPGPAEIASRFD